MPESLCKCQEFGRALHLELISQQTLMSTQMLDGARAVTRGCRRLDQTLREPRVIRVMDRKPLPPRDSAGMFAGCIGRPGERLHGLGIAIREAVALRVPPMLELGAGASVKPLEKRTSIELHRPLEVIRLQRCLEG